MNDHELQCLLEVYRHAPLTKSDFARSCATTVAYLACNGFITTRDGDGEWGNTWRHTDTGYQALSKGGVL